MFGGFFGNIQSGASFVLTKALMFDGVNDYVGAILGSDSTMFDGSTFFDNKTIVTLNCAVKFNDTTTSRQYIVASGSASGQYRFALGRNFTTAGKIGFRVRNAGSEVQITSTSSVTSGVWYFITAVFNSITDEHKLYINDTLEGTSTAAAGAVLTGDGTVYGNEAKRYRFPAPITLCEVSVCDEAFTATQHEYFYNSGAGADIRTISENVAHYHRLNEDLTDLGDTPQTAILYNFTGSYWVDF
jgi:hypothetical protein